MRAGILKQYLGAILRLFKYQKSNIVAKHMAVVGFEEGTVRKICNYVNFFSPFERNLTKLKKKKRKPQTLTLLPIWMWQFQVWASPLAETFRPVSGEP